MYVLSKDKNPRSPSLDALIGHLVAQAKKGKGITPAQVFSLVCPEIRDAKGHVVHKRGKFYEEGLTLFDWDPIRALEMNAHKTIGNILCRIHELSEQGKRSRVFGPVTEKGKRTYRLVSDIKEQPDLYDQTLRRMRSYAASLQRQAETYGLKKVSNLLLEVQEAFNKQRPKTALKLVA